MRKLILILLLGVIPIIRFPVPARGDTVSSPIIDAINGTLQGLPATEGAIWCVREHQMKYLQSVQVAKYQSARYSWLKADLDIGYAVNDFYAGEIVYPLGNLAQFGIQIPIVKQIDINVGYGYGKLMHDNARGWDGGPVITGSYKF